MPSVDCVVSTNISRSARARQLEAMFDVPPSEKTTLSWKGEIPIEDTSWNVGLIVGPSGCGKSVIAKHVFGDHYQPELQWGKPSVIDDFDSGLKIDAIANMCSAVGFNTIPAWLRPYAVLSNGERFRVEIARRLLECANPIVVDEFTSVVDRQVAQIGSYAVQKAVRRSNKQLVAISCHYDVMDWLSPDWVLEPATMTFSTRGSVRRPELHCEIVRIKYEAWQLFAPFHYLSRALNKSAQCFGLYCNGQLASFAGVLPRPHPRTYGFRGLSRLVTLPDWQGLGLAMILADALGSAYKALGMTFRTYPAHPALIRSFDKSTKWLMQKRPGVFSPLSEHARGTTSIKVGSTGARPCAVFEYVGRAMETQQAKDLLN